MLCCPCRQLILAARLYMFGILLVALGSGSLGLLIADTGLRAARLLASGARGRSPGPCVVGAGHGESGLLVVAPELRLIGLAAARLRPCASKLPHVSAILFSFGFTFLGLWHHSLWLDPFGLRRHVRGLQRVVAEPCSTRFGYLDHRLGGFGLSDFAQEFCSFGLGSVHCPIYSYWTSAVAARLCALGLGALGVRPHLLRFHAFRA